MWNGWCEAPEPCFLLCNFFLWLTYSGSELPLCELVGESEPKVKLQKCRKCCKATVLLKACTFTSGLTSANCPSSGSKLILGPMQRHECLSQLLNLNRKERFIFFRPGSPLESLWMSFLRVNDLSRADTGRPFARVVLLHFFAQKGTWASNWKICAIRKEVCVR